MIVATALTIVTSLAGFVFMYMGKVMVDDVIEVTPGRQAAPEMASDNPLLPSSRASHQNPPPDRPLVLDDTLAQKTGKTTHQKLTLLLIMMSAYILFHLLNVACRWVAGYNISIIGQRIVFKLRTDLHDKLQSLQMTYFDQVQTGKLMARVIDDVDVIRTQVTHTIIQMLTNTAMIVIGSIILFSINSKMALVAVCCLPLYAISYRFFVRKIRDYTRKAREINSKTYGYLQQKISGIRVTKSFVQEKNEMLRYHRLSRDYLRVLMARAGLQTMLGVIATIISGLGTAAVLYYGAVLVRERQITMGEMLLFYGTVGALFTPVVAISDMNVIIQWLAVVISRVFDILDEEVVIKDAPDAVNVVDVKGEIRFDNVSLGYATPDPRSLDEDIHSSGHKKMLPEHSEEEDGLCEEEQKHETPVVWALKDINLTIQPGQSVCIMGASGSGKSSLTNLLLRLYEPTEGGITIDGIDVSKIKLTSLRRLIGLVPQDTAMFSGTIADNIRYGAPYSPMEDIIEAAKAAEIHEFIDGLPEKYETKVGEAGITLSGGQKQRLSIARALLAKPRILILDDCTSAVDAQTEARLQETLGRLLSNHTSIIITHRVSMAKRAGKIVVLDSGRLVEEGSHDALIEKRGHYRKIWKNQQSPVKHAVA